MSGVQLSDPSAFAFVNGLWKGEREPMKQARILRSTNLRNDGTLDYSDVAELMVEERYFGQRLLAEGDIIIERSGGGPKQPVGRVALFTPPDDQRYFTSNFTTALRVLDHQRFDPAFVALFLHGLYLSGATTSLQRATTGIRNLDWQEYLKLRVPEMSKERQREIVQAIHGVRTARQVEQNLLEALSDLKRSAMHALFTRGLRGEVQKDSAIGLVPASWEVVAFATVRERLQYGTSARCTLAPVGVPVLRIPNVQPGRVLTADLKFADLSATEVDKYRLIDGDLLFIRTNGVVERLGACAVYAGKPETALFASYLIRAQVLKDRVLPQFISYFLGSEGGTAIIAGRATPAADGKYNINTGTIDSLPIPLPQSLEEQREIVDILDAIDRKIELHRRKRVVLDDLFKSLLHKLMTGEIRVADLDLSALGPDATAEATE